MYIHTTINPNNNIVTSHAIKTKLFIEKTFDIDQMLGSLTSTFCHKLRIKETIL